MTARRHISLAAPATGDDEWQATRAPLESGWLTQGPLVAQFESAFASLCRTPHAVAVSSGTTALHLALAALGIGPGDEVIVPSFTWVATANAVLHVGATPVLVDVDPRTYNIDVAAAAAAITERTRAVVAVHQFGLCADTDALAAVLPPHIPLIEDAACATGAALRGRPAGSLGRAAVFSFHPRKTITCGEGGMLTTADADLAARARVLRSHGAPDFLDLGWNFRMSDVHAAIGIAQLGKLDRFIAERDALVARYRTELADLTWLRPPQPPAGHRHSWQSFVCYLDDGAPIARDALIAALATRGVETRAGTHAVHTLGHIRARLGDRDLPGARACAERTISLPLHNRMSADDVAYVALQLRALAGLTPG